MNLDYKIAKEKMLASDIDGCLSFFKENGYLVETGYCELLRDNIKEAQRVFAITADENIRAKWGVFLCKLIQGFADRYPTYLELRNFLEIDLDILIKNFKGDYVSNILKYADWMCTINPEVHKFIGRVLINNGMEEQGRIFLQYAKSHFYQDPELHYLLAAEYLKENNIQEAKKSLKTCLEVLPGYFPALKLQKELSLN